MNIVTMMGRLTSDVEVKRTTSDNKVANFSIAVDRGYKGADGNRITDFINVVAWNGTAEFIGKWFQKGSMIAISGSLQSRRFEDKEGNKRTAYEVVADKAYFTGGKVDGVAAANTTKENKPNTKESEPEDISGDDDLPF